MYELRCVLTHIGVDSKGHYVAWIRLSKDNWVKLNDEKIEVIKTQDLHFIGENPCILLYGSLSKSQESLLTGN